MSNYGYFTIGFDPDASGGYEHGYWYCSTKDSDYDGAGATPMDAMAECLIACVKALKSYEARDQP